MAKNVIKCLSCVGLKPRILNIERTWLNIRLFNIHPLIRTLTFIVRARDFCPALMLKSLLTYVDVVYFLNVPAYVYQLAWRIMYRDSLPKFITHLWYISRNNVELHVLKHCNMVFVTSRYLYRYYLSKGLRNMYLIPPPIDTELFKRYDTRYCRERLGLPKSGILIGYIGNISAERGVVELLKAFKSIEMNNYKLVLATARVETSAYNVYKKYIKELRGRVIVLKALHYHEIPLFYNAVDIVVLPFVRPYKIFEPPLSFLEAMSCGRPIITTPVGSIPEYVSNNGALLIKPGDVEELRFAIKYLIENRDLRCLLERNARRIIINTASFHVVGRILKTLFENMIERS